VQVYTEKGCVTLVEKMIFKSNFFFKKQKMMSINSCNRYEAFLIMGAEESEFPSLTDSFRQKLKEPS